MYKDNEEKVLSVGYEREEEYKSKNDDEAIEKAIRDAEGNLQHEGMILTMDEKELLRKYLKGEISREEYDLTVVKRAMNSAGGNQ